MSKVPRVFLRMSIGYLLVLWGVDKLVNPAHGLAVSRGFYFGWFNSEMLLMVFGVAQTAVGGLVMAGWRRRYTYPVVVAITGMTLVGVWRSVVDPWGWFLTGSNALFYPSLIIFAAALVLLVEDTPRPSRVRSVDEGAATAARPGARAPTRPSEVPVIAGDVNRGH